jgi:hypothetical protein
MPAFFIARRKYYRHVMEKAQVGQESASALVCQFPAEGTCGNVNGAEKRLKTSLSPAGNALSRKQNRRAKLSAQHCNASVARPAWNTREESIYTKVTGLEVLIICRWMPTSVLDVGTWNCLPGRLAKK